MVCNRVLLTLRRLGSCASEMKSSTNMSEYCTGLPVLGSEGSRVRGTLTAAVAVAGWAGPVPALSRTPASAVGAGGGVTASAMSSRWWGGGRYAAVWSLWFATSATVSVPVENTGGLLTQPMGRTSGTAAIGAAPGFAGKTTPSFGVSPGFKSMR